jgi:hypothetical protein
MSDVHNQPPSHGFCVTSLEQQFSKCDPIPGDFWAASKGNLNVKAISRTVVLRYCLSVEMTYCWWCKSGIKAGASTQSRQWPWTILVTIVLFTARFFMGIGELEGERTTQFYWRMFLTEQHFKKPRPQNPYCLTVGVMGIEQEAFLLNSWGKARMWLSEVKDSWVQ